LVLYRRSDPFLEVYPVAEVLADGYPGFPLLPFQVLAGVDVRQAMKAGRPSMFVDECASASVETSSEEARATAMRIRSRVMG
jgi:hypothetical protein